MAGFIKAIKGGLVSKGEIGVLDATAHVLKFSSFQEMYLANRFPSEFEVKPRKEYKNTPISVQPEALKKVPQVGKPLQGKDLDLFIKASAAEIARILDLKEK